MLNRFCWPYLICDNNNQSNDRNFKYFRARCNKYFCLQYFWIKHTRGAKKKVARFTSEVSLGTCGGGSMGAAPRSSLAIAALLPGHLGALVGGHKLALLLRDLGTLLPCYRAANC